MNRWAKPWSTSLREAVASSSKRLSLRQADELICTTPVCASFGDACACTLSLHLQKLRHLTHLDLSKNRLTRAPDLTRLARLEHLDLSDNQLALLPAELAELPNLESLCVRNNPALDESALPAALRDRLTGVRLSERYSAERQRGG